MLVTGFALAVLVGSPAFADVQGDYRVSVAADEPFAHYAFSELRGASFSSPPDAQPAQTVTCRIWKDFAVKAPKAELYLMCLAPDRQNSGSSQVPNLRDLRVLSAPRGAAKPEIVGRDEDRSPGAPRNKVIERPLGIDGGATNFTPVVARIELTGRAEGLAGQEWVLQPRVLLPFSASCVVECQITEYVAAPITVRPFVGKGSGSRCPAGPGSTTDGFLVPIPQFTREDCIASATAEVSQCASASDLQPVTGEPAGRFCVQQARAKPGLEAGPFRGSQAMQLGESDNFALAVPAAGQWTGEFSVEYWARWRGRFGAAVNMKFGEKSITTGFACDGTGAITTFDVLSSPAVPPPRCPAVESSLFSVVASSVDLSHSAWHHIVLVRTASEMQMWVDGARSNDGAVTALPPVPDQIGISVPPAVPPSDTLIAEPALYLKPLSPERISAHYEAGRRGSDTLCGIGNDDLFLGEQSADKLSGSKGSDEIDGGPGNDTLNGGPGNDSLEGGPGNDRTGEVPGSDCKGESLDGNDKIDAGPGNDVMQGGPGSDQITGGPGKHKLDVGPGADAINVADGERDIVKCGAGRDTVTADRVDKLVGCEIVDR